MKKQVLRWMMLWCFLPGLLTGCSTDRLLFVTKSTVGIDVDSQPPTTEIAINRKEGVIEPVFEGGQTPPVIASFKADANPIARFFGFGIGSTFSTGDAAEALSALFSTTDADFDTEAKAITTECGTPCTLSGKRKHLLAAVFGSYIPLTQKPKGNFLTPGNSDYLIFATDTVLGLKIDWSGGVPTGAKMGFNRKEVAWAPLALCETPANNSAQCFRNESSEVAAEHQKRIMSSVAKAGLPTTSPSYIIKAPAVFASLDATYAVGKNSGLAYQQYFATGRAAVNLVAREQVRRTLVPEFDKTPSDTQRALVEQVETDYVANGALLQKKLQQDTTNGPTLDRVQTFAEAWKFIASVANYTPGQTAGPGLTTNRTALVGAVKNKMDKTAACFQQSPRSGDACADTSAVTAVSAQDLKTLRDLLRLSE